MLTYYTLGKIPLLELTLERGNCQTKTTQKATQNFSKIRKSHKGYMFLSSIPGLLGSPNIFANVITMI